MTNGRAPGTTGAHAGTNGSDPRLAERRADRDALIALSALILIGFAVDVLSAATEASRGSDLDVGRYAFYEATSRIVLLALLPLFPFAAARGFPGVHPWPRLIGVHAGLLLLYATLHIGGMVVLRKLLHPVLFGELYLFTDNLPRELVYELRKDAVTYVAGLLVVIVLRELATTRNALAEARREAEPAVLVYRSGGRTVFIPAADFQSARSEGNYAILTTRTGRHFVRTSLKAIEDDLETAGIAAARVHRSHLVVLSAIEKTEPTGHGDLRLRLRDGSEIPVSRRYRENLPVG